MSKNVKLVWATPKLDKHLAYIARVSNPANQSSDRIEGLLAYMEREGHVSPFTMCNVCYEVNTTRDIGRQMLRHWTIAPQEFSQRYQNVLELGDAFVLREARMQDSKDRQNSLETVSKADARWWKEQQQDIIDLVSATYQEALNRGIAKECARVILPEGNTRSRMYFNANVRSLVHYLRSRLHKSTQKEHRLIAEQILAIFRKAAPVTSNVFFPR